MLIEKLENRLFWDAAVTGAPGHAGILVDVHDQYGRITGTVNLDYYAKGYFGEENGTDGSSDGGDPVTGSDGRIRVVFNPGQTVQSTMGTISPHRIISGGIQGDLRIADFIKKETDPAGGGNGTIDLNAIALEKNSLEMRVDACWAFSTYFVWDTNCYRFADRLVQLESNCPEIDGTSCTWDGLINDVITAQNWLKNHPLRKILPILIKMKDLKEFTLYQQ